MPVLSSTDLTDSATSRYYDGLHGTIIGYGKQSQVELLERDYLKMPIIIKWMGVGKRLKYEETVNLHTHLFVYRDILERNGWSIPKLHEVIIYKAKRTAYISVYEEYIIGRSINEIIQDKSYAVNQKWELFGLLFSLLARQESVTLTVGSKQLHRLPYGVDLKPDNLIIDDTGRIRLVDTFAPKTINDKGQWTSYSKKLEGLDEESLMAVTATREGIVLRFLRLAHVRSPVEYGKSEVIQHLQDCLLEAGVSSGETEFIMDEVKSGYRWLNHLYAKSRQAPHCLYGWLYRW